MRKIIRILFILGSVAALFLLIVLLTLYIALRRQPQWYVEAAAPADRRGEEKASDQMLERVADLTSALETKGDWKIVFTAEEINGWLTVDMPKNHPDLLPAELTDPRVKIEADGVTLAARYGGRGISTVVSLKVDVYLSEENVVAVRIRKARAGSLPWSVGRVVDGLSDAAARSEVRLSRSQIGSDPVVLIKIPKVQGPGRRQVRVTTLRLEEGKIVAAGNTGAKTR